MGIIYNSIHAIVSLVVSSTTTEKQMESIVQSAFAGVIAALTATAILGIAKCIRQWWARRQDVKYIREVLIEGRKRVMEATDTLHKGMNATSSANALRAAQYNNMIKKLGVALEKWMLDLSHDHKKEIFDALDWYHTNSLQAIKNNGKAVYIVLPDGLWPTTEMSLDAAKAKFEKLQSIKWLKLKAN